MLALADGMSVRVMEEHPLVHQYLLRLSDEAATLDTKIEAAVGEMKAAMAEGDRAMYTKIYDNLVAREKDLSGRRAALEAQLAGKFFWHDSCVPRTLVHAMAPPAPPLTSMASLKLTLFTSAEPPEPRQVTCFGQLGMGGGHDHGEWA